MAKNRTTIPAEFAADVLFAADMTCCICREPRKEVQIHHVDDNPANHDRANLAVLCLECHAKTQVKGGFGRQLGAEVVRRYRDTWTEAVSKRRDGAHAGPVVPSPSATDQRRLDELLALIPRLEIRNLRVQDFAGPWPDTLTAPFEVLMHERSEVEHRFNDEALEERRRALHAAAEAF